MSLTCSTRGRRFTAPFINSTSAILSNRQSPHERSATTSGMSKTMGNSESLHYLINHTTRFRYSATLSESVMELRMQPRSEGTQRSLSFELALSPKARVASHRDYLGNIVHHFDVPGRHSQLIVKASAIVEIMPQTI